MNARTKRTPKKDAAFFDRLSLSGDVTEAASHAAYGRTAVYSYRDKDPKFKAKWDAAVELGIDAMEEEARLRAVKGDEEDVWHNGEVVGRRRRKSDTLLIFMLKGKRPHVYRDNASLEVTGKDGADLAINLTFVKPEDNDA
jgi:hypothetical protein